MNNDYSAKKAAMILLDRWLLGTGTNPVLLTKDEMHETLKSIVGWRVTSTRHASITHQIYIILLPFQSRVSNYAKAVGGVPK